MYKKTFKLKLSPHNSENIQKRNKKKENITENNCQKMLKKGDIMITTFLIPDGGCTVHCMCLVAMYI